MPSADDTRIAPPLPIWIASDIHLGQHNPGTADLFHHFLVRARQHAGSLILLGDVFEAWIGDDHALHDPPGWLAQAIGELQHTAAALPLWIGRGNRDFLMGSGLAGLLGARLLADQAILQTPHGPALLAHGDQYCTDDACYQRLRRQLRSPWLQGLFLALPLAARRRVAAWMRQRSGQARGGKSLQIMDVAPAAVQAALDAQNCRWMVHGHTHRPARHRWQHAGSAFERIVLPDWEGDQGAPRGGWLEIDQQGIRLVCEPQLS